MSSESQNFFKAPRYLFRKKNILAWVRTIDTESFLDVGCGAGELTCSLAETGMTGKGIDFSDGAVEMGNGMRDARGIDNHRLSFEKKDITTMKKSEKVDLVICCEVLEHVDQDEALLKSLIRMSHEYVLISVPAKQKHFDDWDRLVGHYRRYEKKDLKNMLESNDLEIVRFANYGYPFTDIVRILRRSFRSAEQETAKKKNMDDRSKNSGINPIKPAAWMRLLNLELLITPFYWFSLLFNRFDLSEGYLVLCRRTNQASND